MPTNAESSSQRLQRAKRMQQIQPFFVMEILDRAYRLQRAGRSVIHLEVGEPDFQTPAQVVAAGIAALKAGKTKYTPALGITELRRAVADQYPPEIRPDLERIAITPGSSGALQLAFAVLLDPGREVLLADPGYPCNRNIISLFGGVPKAIPVGPESAYQLTAEIVRDNWGPNTRAVLLATPSNPTGTIVNASHLKEVVSAVTDLGGVLLVDEIYHGLTYGEQVRTVLHETQQAWVINSFSKYYGMTGWRLGWLVVPEGYIDDVNKLAQNLFISPSSIAQHAALHAFEDDVTVELDRRRDEFKQRRDYMVPALSALGFHIPVTPRGAFYIYADCSDLSANSEDLVLDVLEQTGVAVTPGRDFGAYRANEHVRFSYANTMQNLEQAVARLEKYFAKSR